MNIRKHLGLLVSGGIAAVLAIVALVFLFRFLAGYTGVMGSLEASKASLEQLNARKPFPNEANVKLAQGSLAAMEQHFTNTLDALARGQFVPPPLEPARFPQFLQGTIRGLNDAAASNNVAIPERFAFGFDRYARGLPVKEDLPRLERQVFAVDQICRVLFEAKIKDIVSIDRHVFEDEAARKAAAVTAAAGQPMRPEMMAAAAAGAPGSAAPTEANEGYLEDSAGLFVRERMIIVFDAKENAVWQALNNLARTRVFCVVSDLDIENPAPRPAKGSVADPTRPSGEGAPAAGQPVGVVGEAAPAAGQGFSTAEGGTGTNVVTRPLRREERVTAGMHEVAKVRLQLDLYTFNKPAPDAEKKEGQP